MANTLTIALRCFWCYTSFFTWHGKCLATCEWKEKHSPHFQVLKITFNVISLRTKHTTSFDKLTTFIWEGVVSSYGAMSPQKFLFVCSRTQKQWNITDVLQLLHLTVNLKDINLQDKIKSIYCSYTRLITFLLASSLSLPSTKSWTFRIQDRDDMPIVTTSQQYSPSWETVTLNKINVSLLGTQTTLKCLAKTGSTDGDWFGTRVTAGWPRNFSNTAAMLESAVKLKFQLSSSLRDPWITCLVVL